MRLSQAWTVARHDMELLRTKRGVLYGIIGFPVAISLGFPLLVGEMILPRDPTAPGLWLPGLIDSFGFWFVIGAVILPSSIASYSVVGEKISKSLEPLLATPTSDGEILLGKVLAAFIPTVLAMAGGSLLFQGLMDAVTRGALGYLYYPNWGMTTTLLIAMPITALLATEASVVVSSQVTDLRAAHQYSALLSLPFIFIYVAAEVSLGLTVTNLLYLSAGVAGAAVVLFFVSVRLFRRDEILTRWK